MSPECVCEVLAQNTFEVLSKGKFGKQMHDTLSGADIRAQSVGIDSYTYWGL